MGGRREPFVALSAAAEGSPLAGCRLPSGSGRARLGAAVDGATAGAAGWKCAHGGRLDIRGLPTRGRARRRAFPGAAETADAAPRPMALATAAEAAAGDAPEVVALGCAEGEAGP